MRVSALIPSSSHQTTRSEFDASEYEVRRRYQDFLWLRSKLEENQPTLIISVCDCQAKKKKNQSIPTGRTCGLPPVCVFSRCRRSL